MTRSAFDLAVYELEQHTLHPTRTATDAQQNLTLSPRKLTRSTMNITAHAKLDRGLVCRENDRFFCFLFVTTAITILLLDGSAHLLPSYYCVLYFEVRVP